MRRQILMAIAALLTAGVAHATPISYTFNLSGVGLCTTSSAACSTGTAAGTVSGTFTVDSAFTTVQSAFITVPVFSTDPAVSYILNVVGQTTNVTVALVSTSFLRFDLANGDEFQLNFSPALGANGTTFAITSYEHDTKGNRYLTSGQALPPTPEPSSVVLLGTGLVAMMFFARRRFAL